jgi:hypothetical protein
MHEHEHGQNQEYEHGHQHQHQNLYGHEDINMIQTRTMDKDHGHEQGQ